MTDIRRILFAVRDPDGRRQPGVAKAAALARSLGATLELFHAIASPVFVGIQPLTGTSANAMRREVLAVRKRRLEQAAAAVRGKGLEVTCTAAWDHPPHEAILRRARHIGADLIVAEAHRGSRKAAWLMQLTDWELLRNSGIPVLVLRNHRHYQRPVILAAVDPGHAHDKPRKLDDRILAQAQSLASALHGRVDVVHVSNPDPLGFALLDPESGAGSLALSHEQLTRASAAVFADFARTHELPRARRHFLAGDPATVIPRRARKLRAAIVVMGAVSRSGLKRLFIGNTAERVLGALPCDVLVVKPERFASRVRPKSRGMNVAAAPATMPLPI